MEARNGCGEWKKVGAASCKRWKFSRVAVVARTAKAGLASIESCGRAKSIKRNSQGTDHPFARCNTRGQSALQLKRGGDCEGHNKNITPHKQCKS